MQDANETIKLKKIFKVYKILATYSNKRESLECARHKRNSQTKDIFRVRETLTKKLTKENPLSARDTNEKMN